MSNAPLEKAPCEQERAAAEGPALAGAATRCRPRRRTWSAAGGNRPGRSQSGARGPGQAGRRRGAAAAGHDEHLEEIAEDLLELLKQTKTLQGGLQALGQRMESVEQSIGNMAQTHGRELYALRGELAGERRAWPSSACSRRWTARWNNCGGCWRA